MTSFQLPSDPKSRKATPIGTGVLDYFPLALAAVARVSKAGNDKHNPGEPLHWARGKSDDHSDCLIRHFLDRGKDDAEGNSHSAQMAWRALAILQLEEEAKLTKAEAPKAVSDWIDWNGGPIPVDPQTRVIVRFRDYTEYLKPELASDWAWEHHRGSGDIVAYKVVE